MGIALNGFSTKATKLGMIFPPHSQLGEGEVEYWTWPLAGSDVEGWPSERYPILFYTSSDHSKGDGGIYLRVWDRNLGELTKIVDGVEVANQDAIVEWQDISSRAEFSHITKKTNPIFVDNGNGKQTETPSVIKVGSELLLYYHNSGVDLVGYGGPGGKSYQATKYAVGANGVDFEGNNLSTLWYDAFQVEGDGHNGYFVPEVNNISDFPYTYIGKSLHGGGVGTHGSSQAIFGSNDGKVWEKTHMLQVNYGPLRDDPSFGSGRVANFGNLGEVKKEGAYYRARLHNRFQVSGGASTEGFIAEVLIDKNFNIVSYAKQVVARGGSGEFDNEQVGSCQKTITFEGKTYGFYKAISSSGNHTQGVYLLEDEPYTWDVYETLAEKQTLFETYTPENGIAPDLVYSHAPSYRGVNDFSTTVPLHYTSIVLPADTTPSTAITTQSIDLSAYDVVDVYFDKIGKNNKIQQVLEFGLIDDLASETSRLAFLWPASNGLDTARSQAMRISVLGASDETDRITGNYFGQSANWRDYDDESPAAKHHCGFRIIPSENKLIALEGVSQTTVHDITGFDYTKPLKVFVRNRLTNSQGSNSIFSISDIRVYAYSHDAIAVPAAPTLTTNKTSTSVTLSTNSVSGATGYKYFLDGIEQTDGNFTGLEPETEYTVYARAVNALGDSEPSTIQTVTTDAAGTPDTTAPVVTNNGPATITITVGDTYTPDFSTNEGTLSISNPVDTSTAGTYTVTATATDAAGNTGSATQTVIVEEVPVNQPPTANAGPDQSVAAATQFTLDGTGSQDTDGTIVEWRWTQTAGDTVTLDLENPARPTATSPSKTTAQRLTFQLITVDDEDAVSSPSLVNIDVAAVVQNDVLNIIDKISFTFESDGMITAFPGRANRETFRLKPSDPTGLVLEDGWFDFEANDVRRVEISMLETTGVKIISTDTDSITRERSKLHVRMGDMPIKSSTKEFEPTVSVFVGEDERGVVMTAPGLSGAPKVKYYSTTARAV
tara:strand:- start:330 stop:3329 length:3000 start_codon:yes stop_codon:yes gene_type:complete